MTTQALSPPAEPLPEDSVRTLRSWLDLQRFGIVAAYHVVASYPEANDLPGSDQEELLFELREPPRRSAPQALFLAVGLEMPPLFPPIDIAHVARQPRSVGFSFAPASLFGAMRDVGELLWARDPARPWLEPIEVELVYDRPDVPEGAKADVSALLEEVPQVERAYFYRERLLCDGVDMYERFGLHVEADFGADDDVRGFTNSLQLLLGAHFDSFGTSVWPGPKGGLERADVYERGANR